MTPDDLFATKADADPWGSSTTNFDTELMEQLRRGRADGVDDVDVAEALALLGSAAPIGDI